MTTLPSKNPVFAKNPYRRLLRTLLRSVPPWCAPFSKGLKWWEWVGKPLSLSKAIARRAVDTWKSELGKLLQERRPCDYHSGQNYYKYLLCAGKAGPKKLTCCNPWPAILRLVHSTYVGHVMGGQSSAMETTCYNAWLPNLVAPYCAIPRDYLSDTLLLRAMGFLVSQHGRLGAIPPPPFLSGSHAKWRCDTPPQKGYLSDTCAILYENKANGCDTPLCDTISKGYCAIWGGISHWAAKLPNFSFLVDVSDIFYFFLLGEGEGEVRGVWRWLGGGGGRF